MFPAVLLMSFLPCRANTRDSLLAFYSSRLSEHKHLSATFTQSRYLSMFEKPLVSKGTISYSYPDKIRFHYVLPFESVIVFSGGNMKRYRIDNGVAVLQPSMEIVAKAITREIVRYLSGGFAGDSPYDITVDSLNNRHVILVPSRSAARAVFSRIELFFPADPTYIEKIKLVEPSGDCILIEHDIPSFAPLPDSLFENVP